MFLYELPTTGSVAFSDFCIDHTPSKRYTVPISNATQARANLRASLKETKRGEKDYLKLVKIVDDYLPQLCGIMSCVSHDEIGLKVEPVFSWRSTLSNSLFNSSPRLDITSLHADYVASLLTYAYALSNLARVLCLALGAYELEPAISEQDRRAKDEKLNFAVTLLCRASGVFEFISEKALTQWEQDMHSGEGMAPSRPVDFTREVCSALAKMALADAQTLAIRKLLSKSSFDSIVTPGPPLPKSHPAPGLIAKLHLECVELYSSAKSLAKSATTPSEKGGQVSLELRHYLTDEAKLHGALARKWMGVDAGEAGGKRAGDAVGWLIWAKKELGEMKDGTASGVSVGGVVNSSRERELKEKRKEKVKAELNATNVFLKNYKKVNDSLTFEIVPTQLDLQAQIPAGKLAVATKPFTASQPPFGPGSAVYAEQRTRDMRLGSEQSPAPQTSDPTSPRRTYAGEGSYF